MKDDLLEFKALRDKVQKARVEIARLQGSLGNYMSRLEKEFGCSSISEAEEKMHQMSQELDHIRIQLDERVKAFIQKWGHVLGAKGG